LSVSATGKQIVSLVMLSSLSVLARGQLWYCGARHDSAGTPLSLETRYSASAAGWDLRMPPLHFDSQGCSSPSESFFFSISLPEGNYTITLVLGGALAAQTTVKAEARRVMLSHIETAAKKYRTEKFTVNIRRPEISGDTEVRRKPREIGSLDWDEKLTLEFAGYHPSIRSIRVEPATANTPTLFIAGDSTATDQDHEPWAAWGEMLPAFFGPGIAVANHAESGETIRSFVGEKRFPKIFSQAKQGDYLMMQFGHNDQKPGKGFVSTNDYAELLRHYIDLAREKGLTPILVTPMNRRTFDQDGHVTDTLAPYPDVVRKVATEKHVAWIDLNAMSKTLYEAIGEPDSRSLFVYAAAGTYPDQPQALHDDTHFNSYGAWELARCIVLGLQESHSPLVRYLRRPHDRFDPHHPDRAANVAIPATPFFDVQKPYER